MWVGGPPLTQQRPFVPSEKLPVERASVVLQYASLNGISLSELVVNALALPDQFEIENGALQPVLEALASDPQMAHHFRPDGIAGEITEGCLLGTMKDELRLVGTAVSLSEPMRPSIDQRTSHSVVFHSTFSVF